MPDIAPPLTRRALLTGLAAGGAALALGPARPALGAESRLLHKTVPATGARIPAVGMGTWITFNVGDSPELRAQRTEVLRTFFQMGGGVIDSSPMYGSSEAVVGHGLEQLPPDLTDGLISATKVWTPLGTDGPEQMNTSRRLWGVDRFDIMQVHNMVDWETHLDTLKQDKADGRIGLIGMTTSHGRRHDAFARVMESQPLDAVQFTYNILDREAEDRLLPLAQERGMAVIVNRPFRRGALLDRFQGEPLPPWASEIGAANWPQFLLKFIISHPAVTVAIPATSRVEHMRENMGALKGPLPDAAMRRRMVDYVESL